ncbi:hypothetical protein HMPREF9130_0363 [Peptoniphilus sp. oral taxon 375 str. F0436]|nr:hypothetical protein HMPREF9130_0363 [Peptoniphilus sp. oral taxon 375 str. F0436]
MRGMIKLTGNSYRKNMEEKKMSLFDLFEDRRREYERKKD